MLRIKLSLRFSNASRCRQVAALSYVDAILDDPTRWSPQWRGVLQASPQFLKLADEAVRAVALVLVRGVFLHTTRRPP